MRQTVCARMVQERLAIDHDRGRCSAHCVVCFLNVSVSCLCSSATSNSLPLSDCSCSICQTTASETQYTELQQLHLTLYAYGYSLDAYRRYI